jgi:hypothetical protein
MDLNYEIQVEMMWPFVVMNRQVSEAVRRWYRDKVGMFDEKGPSIDEMNGERTEGRCVHRLANLLHRSHQFHSAKQERESDRRGETRAQSTPTYGARPSEDRCLSPIIST